ncbi:MAG: DUF1223 domain-containing protein [Beijerinckiaceae bacterium]
MALLAVFSLSSAAPAHAEEADAIVRPVVIELFTSQGCSSCPPADRLIAKLAHRPDVIALSLPVDLWDYVGWKDTLALPYHSQRQKHYAKVRGDNRVYTPQAVINGVAHVVGSDPAAIKKQADECYGRDGALSVTMKTQETPAGLRVDLGAGSASAPKAATLWLVRVASSRDVQIKRGENAGHTFTYSNVARGFQRIGEWSGEAASFTVPKEQVQSADSDGWVLLLQAGSNYRPGAILAAAKSPGL